MGRITPEQKIRMLDLMKRHYKTLYGRFTSTTTAEDKATLWQEISDELNWVGTEKTVKQWTKSWTDLQRATKDKLRVIRNHRNRTGGGGPCATKLNDEDQIIINICGFEALDGLPTDELGIEEPKTNRKENAFVPLPFTPFSSSNNDSFHGFNGASHTQVSLTAKSQETPQSVVTGYHYSKSRSNSPSNIRRYRSQSSSSTSAMSIIGEIHRERSESGSESNHVDRRLSVTAKSIPIYRLKRKSVTSAEDTQSSKYVDRHPRLVTSTPIAQTSIASFGSDIVTQQPMHVDGRSRPVTPTITVRSRSGSLASDRDVQHPRYVDGRSRPLTSPIIVRSRSGSLASDRDVQQSVQVEKSPKSRPSILTPIRSRYGSLTSNRGTHEPIHIDGLSSLRPDTSTYDRSRSTSFIFDNGTYQQRNVDNQRSHYEQRHDHRGSMATPSISSTDRSRIGSLISHNDTHRQRSVDRRRSHHDQGHEQSMSRSFISPPRSLTSTPRSFTSTPRARSSHNLNNRQTLSSQHSIPRYNSYQDSLSGISSTIASLSSYDQPQRISNRNSNRRRRSSTNRTSNSRMSQSSYPSFLFDEPRYPDPPEPPRRNLTGTLANSVQDAGRIQKNIERKMSLLCDQNGDAIELLRECVSVLRDLRENRN